MKPITEEELYNTWDTLDRLREERMAPEGRPPGSFTRFEYQERYGLPRATAENELERLVQTGFLTVESRRIKWAGKMRTLNMFTPVEKKEANNA